MADGRADQPGVSARDLLLYAGAAFTLVVGVVHVQQYLDFIADVPTIGELFLLNGLGAGVITILLTTRLRLLGALAGVGLSAGALVSILISRYAEKGLFEYVEPTLRTPVLISVIAEIAAVLALSAYVVRSRQSRHSP